MKAQLKQSKSLTAECSMVRRSPSMKPDRRKNSAPVVEVGIAAAEASGAVAAVVVEEEIAAVDINQTK
jgi:hypothetical protein